MPEGADNVVDSDGAFVSEFLSMLSHDVSAKATDLGVPVSWLIFLRLVSSLESNSL